MALNFTYNSTREQTPGTLSSSGLYKEVTARGNPALGVRGAERAYVTDAGPQDLVENRVTNLLASDNPYVANARSRGLASAAKRGNLNSSIAAGSAERAAIESALPIATTDANTMSQTRMLNQTELNKNLMQERQIQNEMLLGATNAAAAAAGGAAGARQAALEADIQRQAQLQMQRERLAFEGEQGGLQRQFQDYMSRQGYGMDLGRMQAEFGYDIGRAGYGADLSDRSNYRQFLNQMSLDNNRFANNRYDAFIASDLGRLDGYDRFLQELIMQDPSIDPNSLNGVYQFINNLGRGGVDSIWNRYMGRGG
jgi:hypothetical protein